MWITPSTSFTNGLLSWAQDCELAQQPRMATVKGCQYQALLAVGPSAGLSIWVKTKDLNSEGKLGRQSQKQDLAGAAERGHSLGGC